MHIFGGLSGIAATNLAVQGTAALTGVLLARLLGPEGRGDYAIVLLWPGIFSHVFLLGVHVTLARRSASPTGSYRSLHYLGRRISAVLGLSSFALAFASLPILVPADKNHLVVIAQIAALAIPASMWNIVQMHIELGAQRFHTYNLCRIFFGPIYFLICIAVWWWYGATVSSLTVGYVLATFLGALVPYWLIVCTLSAEDRHNSRPADSFELLTQSLPFGIIVGIQALATRVDILWLSALTNSREIGLYVVALAIAMLHGGVGHALGSFFFARTAGFQQGRNMEKWIGKRLRQAVLIYAILCGAMAIIFPPLVEVIFGSAFDAAASLLPGLVVATGITALAEILEEALKGRGVSGPIIIARLGAIAAVSLGGFLLVVQRGAKGMVFAVLFGACIHFLVLLKASQRQFGMPIRKLLVAEKNDIRDILRYIRMVVMPR